MPTDLIEGLARCPNPRCDWRNPKVRSLVRVMTSGTDYCVECGSCGRAGPWWKETAVEAIAEWNQLTAPPMSPQCSTDLRAALEGVLPFVLSGYRECHGDKCRMPNCASCNEDVSDAVDASLAAEAFAYKVLADTKPESPAT